MGKNTVLICGGGSIGRRHISNLKSLGANATIWRARPEIAGELSREFDLPVFTDMDAALSQCSAVVVATSTDQHMAIALKAAERGLDIYIEKPVTHNLHGIEELVRLSENIVVEVGCQLRAHPNLVFLRELLDARKQNGERILSYRFSMGQRLDAWRKGVNYQNGYSADSARGGGALFDLIHQIDLALWLIGPMSSVMAELASYSDLNIEADDLANLLVTHTDGLVGHIQVDMLSPVLRCDLEIITSERIYRWDYQKGLLSEENPEGYTVIHQTDQKFERNHLFKTIMQHFLNRLDNRNLKPLCSLSDGLDALCAALASRKSSELGLRVSIEGIS